MGWCGLPCSSQRGEGEKGWCVCLAPHSEEKGYRIVHTDSSSLAAMTMAN
jgi:hypothetical protein